MMDELNVLLFEKWDLKRIIEVSTELEADIVYRGKIEEKEIIF